MSQEAGTSGTPKFNFSLRHHFHVWVTGYASHSESSTQGSMGSYATVLVYPLQLASRGWSSPAILPPQDWTENLTVNSPTLQPLNQAADEISCQNVSIYCPGCPRTSRKFKNQKFKFCKYRDSNSVPRRCLCQHKRLNRLTTSALKMKTKSESLNLNGHHLVSLRDENVKTITADFYFDLVIFILKIPKLQTHF